MVNVGDENCVEFCEKGRNSFEGENGPLESPVGELVDLSNVYEFIFVSRFLVNTIFQFVTLSFQNIHLLLFFSIW